MLPRLAALLLVVSVSGQNAEVSAAYFRAESEYREQRYAAAKATLDAVWKKYPRGGPGWTNGEATRLAQTTGKNFGSPPFYSALLLLTRCVEARLKQTGATEATRPIRFTVLLVGGSFGRLPRTIQELKDDTGAPEGNRLTPEIVPLLRDSAWLFTEYMAAMMAFRTRVEMRFVSLADINVAVSVRLQTLQVTGRPMALFFARPDPPDFEPVWRAVPEKVKTETDWWWLVYPSHVPKPEGDFASTMFITSGMGMGPGNGSPCFIMDDLWVVRHPAHLGRGAMSDKERRAYLPQWFAHEFFHHLFLRYSEFGLEKAGHQWFTRSAWPADFQGLLEADYFDEAMEKRLKTAARPLDSVLRHNLLP